jgi:diguanylate cyclase (GGDEF)-like protein
VTLGEQDGQREAPVQTQFTDDDASATDASSDRRVDVPDAFHGLLTADGTSVAILGLDGSLLYVNDPALALLGAQRRDDLAPGSAPRALLRSFLDHVPQHLFHDPSGGTWHGDIDHTSPLGEHHTYRATVSVQHDATADDGGTVSLLAHDVSGAREEMLNLRQRASHDPLTGLANRRQILEILADAIGDHRGRLGHVATVFVDLDRLKYVNDALGHRVGDRLLVSVAHRLGEAVRPDDHVARIGGDEFLVVCRNIPDAITALDLAERIRRALSGRLRVNQLDLEFSVSIGVAMTDGDVMDLSNDDAAAAMVSNADTAMYEAKSTGRGRCLMFTSQMRSAARERTELAGALAHSIGTGDLSIVYQPVYSAVTQSVIGAEALARWRHPTKGRIDPATFIAIAEESGTIGRLGEFVLEQAMADARLWMAQQLVPVDFTLHVNVSPLQLASASFVNGVLAMLRRHRLRPQQLVLEARETALLGRDVEVERSFRALRRVGIKVAIDNFGTGANALSVLTDIGADVLKLDGSLALPSGSSDSDTRLVRALVLLAHALDMEVVAERVSGIEQLRRLRAAGCDFVQGNLLGEPVDAANFVAATAY